MPFISNGHFCSPIGVFDSGLGGLTVIRQIRRILPEEDVVYFGDLARVPYGIKSKEQILQFSIQNTLFLLSRKVKAVVIACNSSSSAAYSFLKSHFNVPILDVIEPAVISASMTTRQNRIGVIGTQATVESGVYEKALKRMNPDFQVYSAVCPLFVPLVEEGWLNGRVTSQVAETYLGSLKNKKIDTLILGCTHYPLLRHVIQKIIGKQVTLIDSVEPTVARLAALLREKGIKYPGGKRKGYLKILVSDKPRNFIRLGEKFLGEKLNDVEVVRNQ